MKDKTPQQQAIVRVCDSESRIMTDEIKKQEKSKEKFIYKTALFMKLGISKSKSYDGEQTMGIYKNFCKSHSSVWFSTDSLHGGMSLKKVLEFNNVIKQGNNVEIYFAIGNVGGGNNDIEYKANVLNIVSKKCKIPTPDRLLTPNEYIDEKKYIWIEVNNIQKTSLRKNNFIVISSGNILTKSIKKSQYHFGYIQKMN